MSDADSAHPAGPTDQPPRDAFMSYARKAGLRRLHEQLGTGAVGVVTAAPILGHQDKP